MPFADTTRSIRGSFFVLVAVAIGGGCGEKKLQHDEPAKLFIEALKVRTKDEDRCVELLSQVIELKPLASAYFHRGWIYAKRDRIDAARADVAAGLEIEPSDTDLQWLGGELDKPAGKRSLKMPPSTVK